MSVLVGGRERNALHFLSLDCVLMGAVDAMLTVSLDTQRLGWGETESSWRGSHAARQRPNQHEDPPRMSVIHLHQS